MRIIFAFAILLCSCATVRKNSSSSKKADVHIDTSTQEHQYSIETLTHEKSTAPVITRPDSLQTSGTMSSSDTTTHRQTVESDGMSLTTTVKPTVKDGKVTGYDISSKAVAKPKTIDVPIDRTSTKKETGTDKVKSGISDTKKETKTISSKERSGLSWGGKVFLIGLGIILLCFLVFRLWK